MSSQLPVAQVAGAVFVRWAACASTDSVDVLIALWGVLCEVDPCSKHSSYVGMALIKPFVDDGVDEWGTFREDVTSVAEWSYTQELKCNALYDDEQVPDK